jgi:DNA-binding NarL/FixJ family response regulator
VAGVWVEGTESPAATGVFILDDHELVRRGLRQLIEEEPNLRVVGEAGCAAEAVDRAKNLRPDVALLDVRLPDGDGVEVCRTLLSAIPGIKCLVFSGYADTRALEAARAAGASGFLLKGARASQFVSAIRNVTAGESFLVNPAMAVQARQDAD